MYIKDIQRFEDNRYRAKGLYELYFNKKSAQ